MALQPFLKINTFKGISNENFDEFERLLRAAINVGQIAAPQQAPFLQLNLGGGASNFYNSLDAAVRGNLEQSLTALRNRYNQVENQDFHRIKFQERKFDSEKESPEDFIVELQRLALRAFPNIAAGPGGVPAAVDRADERTRRVKEAFIQGMPLKLKKKLLKEPPERTTDDLGRIIIKEIWLKNTYPDEVLPSAFQQLTTSNEDPEQRYNFPPRGRVEFREDYDHNSYNWDGHHDDEIYNRSYSPESGDRRYNRGRQGSPHPNRQFFCDRCGKYGHTQLNCFAILEENNGNSFPLGTFSEN